MRWALIGIIAAAAALVPAPATGAAAPDEVGFVDPTSGLWRLGPDEEFFFGVPGDIPFLGDWDGDGIDTPGLYRPGNGFAYISNTRQTGVAERSWFMGIPGDIPLAGDWNGDGIDTFSVYRPSEGRVYISDFNTTTVAQRSYYFGTPGDLPFAIDFTGDGIDDIGLHRPTTGLVYMTDARTADVPDGDVALTDLQFFWGIAGDAVFAGDWQGTGTDSPGLVRPSLARTFLRFANTEGTANEEWPNQLAGWVPVVGRIGGAPHRFEVELSGSEVVPGPGADGSGAVTLSVAAGGRACATLDLNGLSGVTGVHIHAGAPGASGPVVLDLELTGTGDSGCVSGDPTAAVALIDRPQDFYIQVHTGAHPGGAMRGQVAERTSWSLALVGAEVAGLGDADGFVTLDLEVSTSGRVCMSGYSAARITTVTSIGLHRADPGSNGPLVANLTLEPDRTGCVVVDPLVAASRVLAVPGGHYVQISTVQYPLGAVRAQLSNGE